MSRSTIPAENFSDYLPRIEAIANAWAYNAGGGREEILKRLSGHAKKGWITAEWIDDAFGALLKNKHLEFYYEPKKEIHMWLAGDNPEQVRTALLQAVRNGFTLRKKK